MVVMSQLYLCDEPYWSRFHLQGSNPQPQPSIHVISDGKPGFNCYSSSQPSSQPQPPYSSYSSSSQPQLLFISSSSSQPKPSYSTPSQPQSPIHLIHNHVISDSKL